MKHPSLSKIVATALGAAAVMSLTILMTVSLISSAPPVLLWPAGLSLLLATGATIFWHWDTHKQQFPLGRFACALWMLTTAGWLLVPRLTMAL